jgi:hypothetical protein
MNDTTESTQARAVIEEYVNACNAGSVDRLKAIFHENALMSGYMMGEYIMGSAEPFFQFVANPPADAPPTAGNYKGEITAVEVSGFMGMNFTDYFHLAKVNGKWLIISKTFNPE